MRKMISVYLSHPWECKEQASLLQRTMENMGLVVVNPFDHQTIGEPLKITNQDEKFVKDCDVTFLYIPEVWVMYGLGVGAEGEIAYKANKTIIGLVHPRLKEHYWIRRWCSLNVFTTDQPLNDCLAQLDKMVNGLQ